MSTFCTIIFFKKYYIYLILIYLFLYKGDVNQIIFLNSNTLMFQNMQPSTMVTDTMEVEPGEIIENFSSEQDKDVLSIHAGEDARQAFSDDEHITNTPVRCENSSDLETVSNLDHRKYRYSSSRDIFHKDDHPKHFRSKSVSHKKLCSRSVRGRGYTSNNRSFGFDYQNWKWRRQSRRDWSFFRRGSKRLCHPLIFCSTQEGYTLTNGSRWHTSDLVSLDTWIDEVFDAIRYLTDNACCESNDLEKRLIVYVPDDLSWRRMNTVINCYKNYWTCTVSLRKMNVEMIGNTRWIPHHRDVAERMLKELTP